MRRRAVIRSALRLMAPAALLILAGCFSGGYSRDAVATRHSAAILEPYTAEPRDSKRLRGLPASLDRAYGFEKGKSPRLASGQVLPEESSPDVKLPGAPERAWDGPPRTRPYYRLDLRPPPPAVAAPFPGPSAHPGTTRKIDKGLLRSGDVIRVTVSGHPEFGGEWIIDERGHLDIPDGGAFGVGELTGKGFSGKIGLVSGKKTPALEKKIAGGLSKYVKKAPQVTVEILARGRG
jgi:hypothetical protein